MRFRKFSILVASVFLFMAACVPQQANDEVLSTAVPTAADSSNDAAADAPSVPADDSSSDLPEPVDEVVAATAISATATSVEVVEELSSEGAACENKPGLAATDPSNVQLASGDVQLVEFFAFW